MSLPNSYLTHYFSKVPEKERKASAIAFFASLDAVSEKSPEITKSIVQELMDQRKFLKLIASENYSSLPVQLAMGNLLTDKYSEGYVEHRFYAGCDNVDSVERQAEMLAKKIFGADHAYMQPHSGSDANLVAFWAILHQRVQNKELDRLGKKSLDELSQEEYESLRKVLTNQTLMGMSLNSGGHLTHGYRHNVSSKFMRAVHYEVDPKSGLLDYDAIQKQIKKERPLILLAGYSSYPRLIDFAKMRQMADSVGAVLMVDMAHFAGLVAGKAFTGDFDPIPHAHVVTSTTHKTLRGPRGGLVLCNNEFKEAVNKGCPLVLGGPLPHVMAAKAVAFKEVDTPDFCNYAFQVIKNAKALAERLVEKKVKVLTGGTDNHLIVFDVHATFGLTGRQAENALRQAFLTVNRNSIPLDTLGAWYTSGIRIGTPAMTTLGMKEEEMRYIADIIVEQLHATKPGFNQKKQEPSLTKVIIEEKILEKSQKKVKELLGSYPLYPELILEDSFVETYFG